MNHVARHHHPPDIKRKALQAHALEREDVDPSLEGDLRRDVDGAPCEIRVGPRVRSNRHRDRDLAKLSLQDHGRSAATVRACENPKRAPVEEKLAEVTLSRPVSLHSLRRLGVKTATRGKGEVAAVHLPERDRTRRSCGRVAKVFYCLERIERDAERARERVHRATRDDPERCAGAGNAVSYFVDVPITAERDHKLRSRGGRIRSDLDAGIARGGREHLETELLAQSVDDVLPPGVRKAPGARVDDQRGRWFSRGHPETLTAGKMRKAPPGTTSKPAGLQPLNGKAPLPEPLVIDTQMHGLQGLTAAFLMRGDQSALVETGPKSSIDKVLERLDALEVDRLDWIIVTHVHLDHAGAAGTLARLYPEATVAVHEVGAPHLIDPTKLWSSAARIYGDAMERLWGGIDPIPKDRIKVLRDHDKIDLGDRVLEAIDTPGHAYHHHAYLDHSTGVLFTGDALGVRLPDVGVIRPATPPPELNVDKAVQSIRRIRELGPTTLWFTHFGPHDAGRDRKSVAELCTEAERALRQWEQWVRDARERSAELDDVVAEVRGRSRAALEGGLSEEDIKRLEQTTSYRMNAQGYMRYLDKQTPRESNLKQWNSSERRPSDDASRS